MKTKIKLSKVNYLRSLLKSVSIIDIIGVSFFFLIIVISAVFFLRKADYVQVVLRVSESDSISTWARPPSWYVEVLKPGLTEKDGLGREVLSITEVDTYLTSEDNKTAYIKMNIRAVYNKRTNQYLYNGIPLLVGSYQTFKLQGVQLMGIVHEIGTNIQPSEKKTYIVKGLVDSTSTEKDALLTSTFGNGISLFRANLFKVGMQVLDSNKEIVARIINVKISPGERYYLSQNTYTKTNDPEKRKVELELEITAEKIGSEFYFMKEQILKTGRTIYVDFEEIDAPIVITEMKSIN